MMKTSTKSTLIAEDSRIAAAPEKYFVWMPLLVTDYLTGYDPIRF